MKTDELYYQFVLQVRVKNEFLHQFKETFKGGEVTGATLEDAEQKALSEPLILKETFKGGAVTGATLDDAEQKALSQPLILNHDGKPYSSMSCVEGAVAEETMCVPENEQIDANFPNHQMEFLFMTPDGVDGSFILPEERHIVVVGIMVRATRGHPSLARSGKWHTHWSDEFGVDLLRPPYTCPVKSSPPPTCRGCCVLL